ncbi:family 20 glycosylhydrolase [Nonomuraea sp. NPDC059194]|uniref:family 20 glycosylhydrolase n=1 Tax=Nonomuraea sp. NPDC059194 TaxID=3346764 RepID=UPI00367605A3
MLNRIVPAPQQWQGTTGTFTLPDTVRVAADEASNSVADTLGAELVEITGISASRSDDSVGSDATVVLSVDAGDPAFRALSDACRAEAYLIRIDDRIELVGASRRGLLWATRSLLQLLTAGEELPRGTVVDWPDYPVRGFLLDVGRRFAHPAFVRDLIRMMSWFKLNMFVVHLNDNEITKDTGRPWGEAQHGFRLRSENPRYAPLASPDGAYTRADWESFEELARRHGSDLVPEIDAPAHARAFIVADPSLGLNDGESDLLDLANPAATEFMRDLVDEFVTWFSGPYFHFGADEYDEQHTELYRDYFNTMAQHVRAKGKVPMAWGSLTKMERGAPPTAYDRDVMICCWNNDWYHPGEAIDHGYRIVNCSDDWLYTVPYPTTTTAPDWTDRPCGRAGSRMSSPADSGSNRVTRRSSALCPRYGMTWYRPTTTNTRSTP